MKDYELRIKLEDELRWATHKYGVFDSKVNNAKEALKPLLERHRLIEEEEKQEILKLEENKAIFFDIVKEKQLALDNIGKSFCQFCERAFAPQGIKAHELSCTSNPANIEAKEVKRLEKERIKLEEEQKRLEEAKRIEEEKARIAKQKAEEAAKAIQNHVEAGIEVNNLNKQECPECHQFYTKGGAFAAHYKSHFPNGNGGE